MRVIFNKNDTTRFRYTSLSALFCHSERPQYIIHYFHFNLCGSFHFQFAIARDDDFNVVEIEILFLIFFLFISISISVRSSSISMRWHSVNHFILNSIAHKTDFTWSSLIMFSLCLYCRIYMAIQIKRRTIFNALVPKSSSQLTHFLDLWWTMCGLICFYSPNKRDCVCVRKTESESIVCFTLITKSLYYFCYNQLNESSICWLRCYIKTHHNLLCCSFCWTFNISIFLFLIFFFFLLLLLFTRRTQLGSKYRIGCIAFYNSGTDSSFQPIFYWNKLIEQLVEIIFFSFWILYSRT